MKILKLIKRILVHKYWVAYYCFQVGLYWQGITHDLSKFSYAEFSRSLKFWNDQKSSLANERDILGYSETFLHHRGRNPHHYEYWIHSLDKGGVPAEMPRKYMLELICDYLGACRVYGNDIRTEYYWFRQYSPTFKMHENTCSFISNVFYAIAENKSLKEAIKYADSLN